MSIQLDDYAELLGELAEENRAALLGYWPEATKVLSPRGLDNYLKGVGAIRSLGRGSELVTKIGRAHV
jgi:hypothetical protein